MHVDHTKERTIVAPIQGIRDVVVRAAKRVGLNTPGTPLEKQLYLYSIK